MYLYGAGGHAKVVLDILELKKFPVKGIFDDNVRLTHLWEYSIIPFPGDFNPEKDELIITIGSNKARKELAEKLNYRFGSAIHPRATISPRAVVQAGTVIMTGVAINADAVIGKHCIINTNASVGHECTLGDYVHISPRAVLCGNVTVGEGTQVGAGAVVIPGITIGDWATIGAGAVIIRDVPNGAVVVGNPGRIIKTEYL